METLDAAATGRRGLSNLEVAAIAAVAAALGWTYAPNLISLGRKWNHDPSYTHGYFIVPIALVILWQRWGRLDRSRLAGSWWGWAALVAVLGLRSFLFARNETWFEDATIPLAVAALMAAFGGFRLLWWSLPGVAFLWFMLPMPSSLNNLLAYPLQRVATLGSTFILQGLGLPALAEGNVIYIGQNPLYVEQACNGLSMLVTFVTLITATTILVERPFSEKVVLMASIVPIALISNILRIVITACAYHQFGPHADIYGGWTVDKVAHDTAGWAMMPIALALVWIELKVLSWLVIEEQVERPRMAQSLVVPVARPPRKKT